MVLIIIYIIIYTKLFIQNHITIYLYSSLIQGNLILNKMINLIKKQIIQSFEVFHFKRIFICLFWFIILSTRKLINTRFKTY